MKKILSIIVLALGAVAAFAVVPHRQAVPDIPGYITLKGDFHIHTNFSDGTVWPVTRVDEAVYDGLDFISITDHLDTRHQHMVKDFGASVDVNTSYNIAAKAGKKNNLIVIHGAELTRGTRIFPGHFNTHFIKDAAPIAAAAEAHDGKYGSNERRQEEEAVRAGVKAAAEQNAFIVWNHPVWEMQARNETIMWPIHEELIEAGLVHGIEVYNNFSGYDADAFHWAIQRNLAIVTGTDAHYPMFTGVDYEKGEYRPVTLVFARERSAKGIREALESRRTAALCDGCVYGPDAILGDLLAACLEIRDIKYSEKKVSFTLRNRSTIPIELAKAPGSEQLTYVRWIRINAGEEVNMSVNGADSRKPIGLKEFDVNFFVNNWLVDAGVPLNMAYHFAYDK